MTNSNSHLPGPTVPDPIIRNLQNGLITTASADLGKSAVTNQVGLLPKIDQIEPIDQSDRVYQGIIEINHDDKVSVQTDNSTENTEEQKPVGRQVHNHYIEEPKPTLKELENQYPNESPLLASN